MGRSVVAVGLLEKWDHIVEVLEVEAPVDSDVSAIVDDVAISGTVFEGGTAFPVVCRAIVEISCEPFEGRNEAKRQFIG